MTTAKQSATLPDSDTTNAKNLEPGKELVERLVLVAIGVDDAIHDVVDARWYMARRSDGASPIYCSVWVHGINRYFAGHGKASGYGYFKQSAAFDEALDSAGIKLARRVDGVGMSAVREAMQSVAIACGFARGMRIVAYRGVRDAVIVSRPAD